MAFSRSIMIAGVAAMAIAATAFAHVPYLETGDYSWDSPFRVRGSIAQSIAVYSFLTPDRGGVTEVDVYQFTIRRDTPVFVQVLVPVCPAYAAFRPSYAIVGPGLPAPGQQLPFDLPGGYGAIVVADYDPPQAWPTMYEPFGNQTYYQGPTFDQTFSTPGTYYVVYWDPAGLGGDYVAVLGDKEIWRPLDIIRALINTPKIRRGQELHSDCR
jgi:hypothetical protein